MNTEENVVKMPDRLERRAQKIEAAMARRARGEAEWIEGTIELAVELAGARMDYGVDKHFGKWLDARFGESLLSKNERYILIQWGASPDKLRAVLEKTKRRSIEYIHRTEWEVPRTRNHQPTHVKRVNRIEAAAEALKTETGHWPHKETLATVAGVHPRNADNALRTVKAVEEATGHAPEIRYTKAQDHHVEARIRAATNELEKAAQAREASFWEKVTEAANASCEKRFPNLQERENDVVRAERHWRTVANNHKPIFTEVEYRDLLLCTHEANPSDETKKRAFMALNAKKLQLTGKK